jgi:hypothetical protein
METIDAHMIKTLIRPFMRASDFVFVAEVIALAIVLSGVLLLLVIAVLPTLRTLSKGKQMGDEKESPVNSVQWAFTLFGKMTATQVIWSTVAYLVFCLVNVPRAQSRLFIVAANVIGSVAAFAESMRQLLRSRRKLKGEGQKTD